MDTKLQELTDQVFDGQFETEQVLEAMDALPPEESRGLLRDILDVFKGKVTLLNIASDLTPQLELAPLIRGIVHKISSVLGAERTSLFLVDRERRELWSKVAEGLETQEIRLPLDQGIAGRVATTGETLVIDDAYSHPLFNREIDKKTGYRTRTLLCMPIRSPTQQIIGVVQAINKTSGRFESQDIDLLRGITYILALTLENSLLYEKVSQGQRQVATLLKVANALNSKLDLNSLIQTILSKASELLTADRSSLFLIDRETDELYSRVAQGLSVSEIRFPRSVGIAGSVATTGQTLNIADAYEHPLFNKEFDRTTGYRTKTILCVPIRDSRQEIRGVAQVINKKAGVFTSADEELLKAFSAQAAIAIENAQLYERTTNLKNFYESILQSLSDAVLTIDPTGIITMANQSAFRLLGLQPDALLQQPYASVFARDKVLAERIQKMESAEQPHIEYDHSFTTPGGRDATVNFTVLPLWDTERKKVGLVLIVEDITKEKRIKANLTRYMAKDLVEKVLSEREQIRLGGVKQEVSVLFSDIRSFTTLTERSTAAEVVDMLNAYFSEMVEAVFRHRGVLDKFIGDAIMAVFGAPLPLPDHPLLACRSALDMRRQLVLFNRRRVEQGKEAISIGIGISSDEVLCGNIGSEKRMEYTAIGDGVNLASRLEGANKVYGTDIMISEFTHRMVGPQIVARELDWLRVKGKTRPVRVFEVVSLVEEPLSEAQGALLARYREGFELYHARRFREATDPFERALEAMPGDTPSLLYLERCRHFAVTPPAADWDGVWQLKDK
ncbi:MAG: GAF domain-containing protein [Candidatus Riflebacteria bacterium]|nr:GAF domain-containing protein [Candidatus Riflebacteria bacterium]